MVPAHAVASDPCAQAGAWPVLSTRQANLLVLTFSRSRLLRTDCVVLGGADRRASGEVCPALQRAAWDAGMGREDHDGAGGRFRVLQWPL